MTFTPDGGELVTTSNDSSMIHIWDLRAIQEELAKMGLNLQLPPFPRARPVARQPLQVQVEGGDRAKASPDRPEIDQPFLAQKRRAVEANPNSSLACNNLAWAYLTAPAPLRDVKAAVPLAEKAVRLEPSATYRNTLALAYYRAGRYREAVRILESNLHDQPDWLLAYDLYFLAMCHHQLTDGPRARQFLALADRWSASHRQELTPHVGELTTFRAEANELLGAGKKKD